MNSAINILVVEDSDVDFDILESVVGAKTLGPKIHLSRFVSGELALKNLLSCLSADSPLPGLIIMDLNLVGMSGVDFIMQLRSNSELRHLPTVILSTSNSPADVNRAYEAGANTYLCKSLQLEEFESVIHRMIDYWFHAAVLPTKTDRKSHRSL